MRTVAQYAFDGATCDADQAKLLFNRSSQAIESWLTDKGEIDSSRKKLVFDDGRIAHCDFARSTCAAGSTVKLVLVESTETSRFSTAIELANSGAEVALSCVLSAGYTNVAIAPRPFVARCPKVLREVLSLRPGWRVGASEVLCQPVIFRGGNEIVELVKKLLSPNRAIPLVAVSSYDGFMLHPNLVGALAADICGLGTVVQLDEIAAWELTKSIGKEWSCYNGAIRVYWPHLDLQSDPRAHPVWTSARLIEKVEDTEHASRRIRNTLRRRLFAISTLAVEPPLLFRRIDSERAKRLSQERIELATTADEYKQLAQEYAYDNDDLRMQLEQEQDRVRQLREDLYRIQLTQAWSDSEEEIEPVEETPLESVEDAVDRARKDFAHQLTFGCHVAEGVQSLARNAGPPDKIYDYLRVLAEMVDLRRGGGLGESPIKWLQKQGVSASGESESIQNNKKELQKRTWNDGRALREFLDHLKPADGVHPDRCVRIYFDWDDASAKILIGWVGRHP